MKRLLVAGAVCVIAVGPATAAGAHQSGCHRWHSCPSDTGSYVCGDLGYDSGCPVTTGVEEQPAAPPVMSYDEWVRQRDRAATEKASLQDDGDDGRTALVALGAVGLIGVGYKLGRRRRS